jgi:hypothetical protein
MNDTETIAAAYADALKLLYKVMTSSYVAAEGNKAVEKKADDAFKAGLELARKVRDRALALVK